MAFNINEKYYKNILDMPKNIKIKAKNRINDVAKSLLMEKQFQSLFKYQENQRDAWNNIK